MKILFSYICLVLSVTVVHFIYRCGVENEIWAYAVFFSGAVSFALPLYLTGRAFRHVFRRLFPDFIVPRKEMKLFNFRIVCHLGFCYALFKLILGAYERSLWITSFGVYYLVVSIIRFNIIKKRNVSFHDFRMTGWLFLVLNLCVSILIILVLCLKVRVEYPSFTIYIIAAWTFLSLFMSLRDIILDADGSDLVFVQMRNIRFSVSLVSLFSLQCAVFSRIDHPSGFEFMMNSILGFAIVMLIFALAVSMLFRKECL